VFLYTSSKKGDKATSFMILEKIKKDPGRNCTEEVQGLVYWELKTLLKERRPK
jgi:hypothetical protein